VPQRGDVRFKQFLEIEPGIVTPDGYAHVSFHEFPHRCTKFGK
jgi:hypothetical protein